MPLHLTPAPNLIPKINKRKRDNRHAQTDKCDYTATPIDAHSREHGLRGKRQDSAPNASAATGSGLRAGGKDLVCVGEVVQHGHEDEFVGEAECDAGHHGYGPVDVGGGGPAEPEE